MFGWTYCAAVLSQISKRFHSSSITWNTFFFLPYIWCIALTFLPASEAHALLSAFLSEIARHEVYLFSSVAVRRCCEVPNGIYNPRLTYLAQFMLCNSLDVCFVCCFVCFMGLWSHKQITPYSNSPAVIGAGKHSVPFWVVFQTRTRIELNLASRL